MSASKSALERHTADLDAHYKARREQGLPAHRAQEHKAEADGWKVETLAGSAYVSIGDGEVVLDQAGVFTLIQELQAAFQAVS